MKTFKVRQTIEIIRGYKTIEYEVPANTPEEAQQLVEDCEAFDYIVNSEIDISESEQIDIEVKSNTLYASDMTEQRELLISFMNFRDDIFWGENECVENEEIIDLWFKRNINVTKIKS